MENFDVPGYIKGDSGYKKPLQLQIDLEFSRYKQDCRKRALDLAHSELSRLSYEKPHPLQPTVASKPNPEEVIKVADKYYNWLISIPQ